MDRAQQEETRGDSQDLISLHVLCDYVSSINILCYPEGRRILLVLS